MMTGGSVLLTILLGTTAIAVVPGHAPASAADGVVAFGARRPSILVIMPDQIRAECGSV